MATIEEIDPNSLGPDMTVEDFLKKQCDDQITRLKNHAEKLVEQFQNEAKEVREKLVISLK